MGEYRIPTLDLMQALSFTIGASQPQHAQQIDSGFVLSATACAGPSEPFAPALGTPQCSTVGSQGHWYGTCRPCAFLYTKGCMNGVNCPFCHLCEAGEKKRRAKEQRAL